MPDLATGAGVEVPCVVDREGPRPLAVDPLPPACAALNRQFLSVVDLTVRAAVEQSPELVRQALMVDPNTAATLSLEAIWDLADDMVRAHGDRLPPALREPLPL
jgi:alpha-galactosidase